MYTCPVRVHDAKSQRRPVLSFSDDLQLQINGFVFRIAVIFPYALPLPASTPITSVILPFISTRGSGLIVPVVPVRINLRKANPVFSVLDHPCSGISIKPVAPQFVAPVNGVSAAKDKQEAKEALRK